MYKLMEFSGLSECDTQDVYRTVERAKIEG